MTDTRLLRCCSASGCRSAGSEALLHALRDACGDACAENLAIKPVGCLRLCGRGPLVARDGPEELERFKQSMLAAPEVQQCYYVTGEDNFVVIIALPEAERIDVDDIHPSIDQQGPVGVAAAVHAADGTRALDRRDHLVEAIDHLLSGHGQHGSAAIGGQHRLIKKNQHLVGVLG